MDIIAITKNLLQINSPSSEEFLSSYLSSLGFEVKIINKEYIWATIGKGKPHLVFAGYIDKPIFKPQEFGEYKEGKLYGQGCISNGSLGCAVKAVEEILQENKGQLHISFLVNTNKSKSLSYIKPAKLKKIFNADNNPSFCLAAIPQSQKEAGEQIAIGAKGYVIFCIKSFSRSGFPSLQNDRQNSLHNMLDLLAKIKTYPLDSGNEYFGPSNIQILSITSSSYQEKTIPEEVKALVGVYYNSNHNKEEIIEWMKKNIVFSRGEFELSYNIGSESYITQTPELVEILQSATQKVLGKRPDVMGNDIPNFAASISNICPLLIMGLPAAQMMSKNEYITYEDTQILIAIYREVMKKIFG